jgi:hypothetical protein
MFVIENPLRFAYFLKGLGVVGENVDLDTLFVQHLDEMYGCNHSEVTRREVTVQHCKCGALGLYDTHEED